MEKRHRRAFASSIIMALVFTTAFCNTKVLAKDRLSGVDRYETSTAISTEGWNEGAEYVVIASGDDFADALCASPLAKAKGAPILLTSKDKLKDSAIKEIQRLKAPNIIVIGGTGAVSSNVEKQLRGLRTVKNITRIYGKDRYETSLKIAKELGEVSDVAVVTGKDYADALSIAPVAAQKGMPILMVSKDNIKVDTLNYIKGINKLQNTYIIGGQGIISKELVEDKLTNVKRLYGSDRYSTNVEVMKEFKNELDFKKIYLSRGNGPKKNEFADALAGSALAAKYNAPVILVDGKLSENTKDFVKGNISPNTEVIFLGGEKVLSSEASKQIGIVGKKYSEESKTYGSQKPGELEKIDNNVLLNAKNITLQNAEISGNVYMEKEGTNLKNVKVSGIIYINQIGEVNLENVQAREIRVLNASQNGVHLKDVTCGDLNIEVKHQGKARIKLEGKNKITNTVVTSSAILEALEGGLGKVSIEKSSQKDKVVELKGKFDQVTIAEKTNVELAKGTVIKEVKTEGNGKKSKVEVPKGAKIEKAEEGIEFTGEGAKEVGKAITPTIPVPTPVIPTPTPEQTPTPTPTPTPTGKAMKVSVSVNGLGVKLQIDNLKYSTVAIKVVNIKTGDNEWLDQIDNITGTQLSKEFSVKKPGRYYAVVRASKVGATGESEIVTTEEFDVEKNL